MLQHNQTGTSTAGPVFVTPSKCRCCCDCKCKCCCPHKCPSPTVIPWLSEPTLTIIPYIPPSTPNGMIIWNTVGNTVSFTH